MASTDIFQQVSLAEAAYADFRGVDFDDAEIPQRNATINALTSGKSKFSPGQAEAFVDQWKLIAHR